MPVRRKMPPVAVREDCRPWPAPLRSKQLAWHGDSHMPAVHLLLPLVLAVTSAGPAYRLQTAPTKTVEATITYDVRADKLEAKDWVVIAPVLAATAGQTNVTREAARTGKEIVELSDLK